MDYLHFTIIEGLVDVHIRHGFILIPISKELGYEKCGKSVDNFLKVRKSLANQPHFSIQKKCYCR